MSDFKAIETQEELDRIIKGRLAQKDREAEEKYKDYLSPEKADELKKSFEEKLAANKTLVDEANAKLKDHDKIVSELITRAETAEKNLLKNRLAYDNKLPLELANRLVGDTEEDLKKDAENLAKIVGIQGSGSATPPLFTNDVRPNGASNKDAAIAEGFSSLLTALKGAES